MVPEQWLTETQRETFTARSNTRALWVVAANWLLIAAIFAGVAWFNNPLGWLLGAALLGGRHMGLAILMHECGHNTLFASTRLNQWVGQWLCAYPILADCRAYAESHRVHHRLAGSQDDPDLANYRTYPVPSASLRRKLWRDLSGQTGVRNLLGQFSGGHSNLMMRSDEGSAGLVKGLVVNAGLFAVLWWAGVAELYLVWVAGYLIFYPAIARIRQLAEHGAVINLFDPDPRAHTRSIQASWLERLLLCPNRVNYHLEHHFLASVPCYRLPALHGHLRSAGFYDGYDAALASGYRAVLKGAVQAAA